MRKLCLFKNGGFLGTTCYYVLSIEAWARVSFAIHILFWATTFVGAMACGTATVGKATSWWMDKTHKGALVGWHMQISPTFCIRNKSQWLRLYSVGVCRIFLNISCFGIIHDTCTNIWTIFVVRGYGLVEFEGWMGVTACSRAGRRVRQIYNMMAL